MTARDRALGCPIIILATIGSWALILFLAWTVWRWIA